MNTKKLTRFQKLMLLNAHPLKQLLNYIGGAIGLYFLWLHKPFSAAIYGFGIIFFGSLISIVIGKSDPYETVKTNWGKIFLHYTSIKVG